MERLIRVLNLRDHEPVIALSARLNLEHHVWIAADRLTPGVDQFEVCCSELQLTDVDLAFRCSHHHVVAGFHGVIRCRQADFKHGRVAPSREQVDPLRQWLRERHGGAEERHPSECRHLLKHREKGTGEIGGLDREEPYLDFEDPAPVWDRPEEWRSHGDNAIEVCGVDIPERLGRGQLVELRDCTAPMWHPDGRMHRSVEPRQAAANVDNADGLQ